MPLAAYWQTIFHEYGFRDDYAHLREVREEPGKLTRFASTDGRPVYGALLEKSFAPILTVTDLPWLRLTGVLLITAVGLILWRQLLRAGWSDVEATAVGLGITLLPSSQVIAGWAISWPVAFSMLLAVTGFAAIEAALQRQGQQRLAIFAIGCACYLVSGLTYQSNTLFAIVPLAALLMMRSTHERIPNILWTAIHLATVFINLALGLLLMKVLFMLHVFPQSGRMHLEPNPLGKLIWFFSLPLSNALALGALRDTYSTGVFWFWSSVAAVVCVLGLGFREDTAGNTGQKMKWLFCLLVLPFVAHSVSLAAAVRANGYRTLFPLAGLVVVLAAFSIRRLRVAGRISLPAQQAALAAAILLAAVCANRNAFSLIAEPQSREWDMVRDAVNRLPVKADARVYIITPTLKDRSTQRVFADEFGSLSSNSDWVPKEMFKTAVRDRFSGHPPAGYTLAFGPDAPNPTAYDVVIDLRKLKDRHTSAAVPAAGVHMALNSLPTIRNPLRHAARTHP